MTGVTGTDLLVSWVLDRFPEAPSAGDVHTPPVFNWDVDSPTVFSNGAISRIAGRAPVFNWDADSPTVFSNGATSRIAGRARRVCFCQVPRGRWEFGDPPAKAPKGWNRAGERRSRSLREDGAWCGHKQRQERWVMRTSCEPESVLFQFPVSQILVPQLYTRLPCCTHPAHDAPFRRDTCECFICKGSDSHHPCC